MEYEAYWDVEYCAQSQSVLRILLLASVEPPEQINRETPCYCRHRSHFTVEAVLIRGRRVRQRPWQRRDLQMRLALPFSTALTGVTGQIVAIFGTCFHKTSLCRDRHKKYLHFSYLLFEKPLSMYSVVKYGVHCRWARV